MKWLKIRLIDLISFILISLQIEGNLPHQNSNQEADDEGWVEQQVWQVLDYVMRTLLYKVQVTTTSLHCFKIKR